LYKIVFFAIEIYEDIKVYIFIFKLIAIYSNLSASIGFIFAAFLAGHTPNTIPVPSEKSTAIIIAFKFNNAGTPNFCKAKMIHRLITTPIIHPMSPKTKDSLKNWIRIL